MLCRFGRVEQLQEAVNAYMFVTLIKNQVQDARVLQRGVFRL